MWLFDVGNGKEALSSITSLPGEKSIVLSHFHPDHIANIESLSPFNLFVSKNTEKYVHKGNVVEKEMYVDDGVNFHILPFPSAHAKGCLALEVAAQYLFVGDALYPTSKNGIPCYNVGILIEQISLLKKLPSEYVLRSHNTPFVETKEKVIEDLTNILTRKTGNGPYIFE